MAAAAEQRMLRELEIEPLGGLALAVRAERATPLAEQAAQLGAGKAGGFDHAR
ncbi:hypothetical protein GCM10027514_27000 [Azotobacter armeniacus]